MKDFEAIMDSKRLSSVETGSDGGRAVLTLPNWQGSVIWSFGGGWEHVSVSPFKHRITPSWEDMCRVKDIFFKGDEWVVQFHPPKEEYVNNVPNCLHLWRPIKEAMPVPPWWMVGVKKGKTVEDAIKEMDGGNNA